VGCGIETKGVGESFISGLVSRLWPFASIVFGSLGIKLSGTRCIRSRLFPVFPAIAIPPPGRPTYPPVLYEKETLNDNQSARRR
jgi:hypothetical protein